MVRLLPVFPLGTVLFPSVGLPLHVFEERYRQLVRDVLDTDGEFGVTLIERGHEVGGGDTRTDVGTVARIVQAEELPDGRWVLATIGTARFRVERWLEDDPYPKAEIVDLDEQPAGAEAYPLRDEVSERLGRVLDLLARLEEVDLPEVSLHPDPEVAALQAAALSPIGPLDKQAVLEADAPTDRLRLLITSLDDAELALRFRLSS